MVDRPPSPRAGFGTALRPSNNSGSIPCRLDAEELIAQFVRRVLVKDNQQAANYFLNRATARDDYAVVLAPLGEILARQHLEIATAMGQDGVLQTNRMGQLIGIAGGTLARLPPSSVP